VTNHQFTPWPKTARLFRGIVVTEKIDGTNAAIHVTAVTAEHTWDSFPADSYTCVLDGVRYVISAQSRKRLIYPGKSTDNFGFAGWVYDNARDLVRVLGEGLHYGEWWGQGIQRGYGRDSRSFSLFNTARYVEQFPMIENGMELSGGRLDVVPVLYEGPNDTAAIRTELYSLKTWGSSAVPGWETPEGICVYHTATRSVSKVTLDANDAGKWEAGA